MTGILRYDVGSLNKGYAMFRTLLIALSFCMLTACFHMPIIQGNVLTNHQKASIHKGMSQQQVLNVLGYPVFQNVFKDNRLVYVYYAKPTRSHTAQDKFIVTFRNNKVISIQ